MAQVLNSISCSPAIDSVDPAIAFIVEVELDEHEALVKIGGEVRVPTGGAILSRLTDAVPPNGRSTQQIAARQYWNNSRQNRRTEHLTMVGVFSRLALSRLEDERLKNPKRDVLLELRLAPTVIRSRSQISPTNEARINNVHVLSIPQQVRDWQAEKTTSWLLSGDGSPDFLLVESWTHSSEVRIPAEDWRHDYGPNMGLGRFVVSELPWPAEELLDGPLKDHVERATHALGLMVEASLRGDWDEVVRASRPISELLRSEDVWSFLETGLGYEPERVADYRKSVRGMFDFASKSIHTLDRAGKLRTMEQIPREDAELLLAMSVGLVHQMAKKINRAASA